MVCAYRNWLFPVLSLVLISSAGAHHSRAGFDLDNETRLSGTVTEVRWANPHIYLRMDMENGENWLVEGHSVPGAMGLGWTRDTVRVGDEIMVGGNVALDPEQKFALMNWIVTRDGTAQQAMPRGQVPADLSGGRVAQGRPRYGPPPDAQPSTDFSGNWSADLRGRNLATGVFDPNRNLPLTAAGQAVLDEYRGAENPAYQCLPGTSFAGALNAPYSNRIVRFDDRLEIHKESTTHFYTIWLDEAAAPGNHVPDRPGLTIGRYEDERTLAWQTTRFAPSKWGLSRGVDSSEQKEINGRFELAEDGMSMTVTWTISDPVYFREPVMRTARLFKDVDREFDPEPCDPEVSSMHLQP